MLISNIDLTTAPCFVDFNASEFDSDEDFEEFLDVDNSDIGLL
jgi:hypothetical protein